MGMCNQCVKFALKIPNRFGKMSNISGGGLIHTVEGKVVLLTLPCSFLWIGFFQHLTKLIDFTCIARPTCKCGLWHDWSCCLTWASSVSLALSTPGSSPISVAEILSVCTHRWTLIICNVMFCGCASRLCPWATTLFYLHLTSGSNSSSTVHNVFQQQYADDTQLYAALSSTNHCDSITRLQSCLSSLDAWFYENGMAPIPTKSDAFSWTHLKGSTPYPALLLLM